MAKLALCLHNAPITVGAHSKFCLSKDARGYLGDRASFPAPTGLSRAGDGQGPWLQVGQLQDPLFLQ